MCYCVSRGGLKPVRGKRVWLNISNKAPYHSILKEAIQRWKAYHSDMYDDQEDYILVLEDGQEAQFLPGTDSKEFFSLHRYKQDILRDYTKITLYLCTSSDHEAMIDSRAARDEMPEAKKCRLSGDGVGQKADEMVWEKSESVTEINEEELNKPVVGSDKGCELEIQLQSDKLLAEQLDEELNGIPVTKPEAAQKEDPEVQKSKIASCTEAIKELQKQVDESGHFFMVVRRGSDCFRKLKLWQHEARKKSPKQRLMVKFAGEAGIDDGALAKEYLGQTVTEIGKSFFLHGGPIDSMLHVHNGNFKTCGQVVAVSIVEGGPAPRFLEDSVYELILNSNKALKNIGVANFTASEKMVIESIRANPIDHKEYIMEHGYTGIIHENNVYDIIWTVMVSIMSRKQVFINEFAKGLELFGLLDMMKANPELFPPLFVIDFSNAEEVDANYVVSILKPEFSGEGTSRQSVEEGILDYFQDFLISLENNEITGYKEMLASDVGGESSVVENDSAELYNEAELTPAGVLGWMTGQKHRPINGETLNVTMFFDHDCLERNPNHTICFPIVEACSREITFPVSHMKDCESFKKVLLLAYCKGQCFANH